MEVRLSLLNLLHKTIKLMIVLNKIALILELNFGSLERIGKPMEINFDSMKFCKCSKKVEVTKITTNLTKT